MLLQLLTLLFLSLLAQDNNLTATLTPANPTAHVGDAIALELWVVHPAGYRLLPPELGETWGAFEVWDLSPVTVTANGDGTETSQQTITVTLWEVGEFATPPLPLRVSTDAGEIVETTAVSTTLTIESVLVAGDSELRDIKPQAELPFPPVWPWYAGGGLVAVLVGWRVWRRVQRGKTAVSAPIDPRTPTQIIMDELSKVMIQDLPAAGRFKEQYTLVSDLLRRYLTDAHNFPAIDMTTAEVRAAIDKTGFRSDQRKALLGLLDMADWVKFTDMTPSVTAANEYPIRVLELIKATAPGEDRERML
ncbi:MAG: hypothetical protein H6668_07390 [Ardenticatenaceae bacterium]|nr:hypothetical protein [Ardenticatenaceae bacterium]